MRKLLRAGFILVMIMTILWVIWYIPVSQSVRSRLAEVQQELDTSLKREDKQRYEYAQVVEELPLVIAELEEKQPQAESAVAEITVLKAERKTLRAEKKALEASLQSGEEAVQK